MTDSVRSAIQAESGATSLEYGIMLVLTTIALTVLLALVLTGNLL